MLIGIPPFYSENPTDTCKKILNWKKYFSFPKDKKISKNAQDLISKLICDVDTRLGTKNVDEIKKHPFFKQIDWNNILKMKTPFKPDVIFTINNNNI